MIGGATKPLHLAFHFIGFKALCNRCWADRMVIMLEIRGRGMFHRLQYGKVLAFDKAQNKVDGPMRVF
jgi:hypothetical protein